MLKKLLIFLGLLTFLPPVLNAQDLGRWAEFAPPGGKTKAQVMVLATPKDVVEISQKIEQAQKDNPEFFEAQAAAAKPGEALPYDSRLGITEAEYARLLEGAQTTELQMAGEADLEFSVNSLGLAQISGLPANPPNDVLKYDLEQEVMYTPFGDLVTLARVAQDDENSATGPWQGFQWSMYEESEQDLTVVRFAIGQLKNEPKNLIYYDVSLVRSGQSQQFHYILFYDRG